MKRMNRSVSLFLALILILSTATICLAIMPSDSFVAVKQGSSQCGPASFYMIFNHYHDQGIYTKANGTTTVDLSAVLTQVTSSTAICKYINNGSTSGTTWTQLANAANGLYKNGLKYYNCELNDVFTEYNDTAGETERQIRFNRIYTQYLLNNRPVMIHIRRIWPYSGHYVVVTGYNPQTQTVYYADPYDATNKNVSYDSFIKNKWYVSSASPANGRWDGEWMGFYH
ncbi:MAG: C39 family peptidase [Ignavibacteriales bacterium]